MYNLNLSDLRDQFSIGDKIRLLRSTKTKHNSFKKGDLFEVINVSDAIIDCLNKNDSLLTLHRFIVNEYVEKCNDT